MTVDLTSFTGEKLVFLTSASSPDLLMEVHVAPGSSSVPLHKHPRQSEHFSVVQGILEVRVGARWLRLGRGEEVLIPANTPHTFRNGDSGPLILLVTLTPALHFQELMIKLEDLVRQGKITAAPRPASVLHLALLFTSRPDTLTPVQPPLWLMKSMACLARRFAYRI